MAVRMLLIDLDGMPELDRPEDPEKTPVTRTTPPRISLRLLAGKRGTNRILGRQAAWSKRNPLLSLLAVRNRETPLLADILRLFSIDQDEGVNLRNGSRIGSADTGSVASRINPASRQRRGMRFTWDEK